MATLFIRRTCQKGERNHKPSTMRHLRSQKKNALAKYAHVHKKKKNVLAKYAYVRKSCEINPTHGYVFAQAVNAESLFCKTFLSH